MTIKKSNQHKQEGWTLTLSLS